FPLYSAFDGVNEYTVTPSIATAETGSFDADPVLASSLKWEFDSTFFSLGQSTRPGTIKLVTKKSGSSVVEATGHSLSGDIVTSKTRVTISRADATQWQTGNERYNSGELVSWPPTGQPTAAPGEGTCGLLFVLQYATTAACSGCHNDTGPMRVEGNSAETAMYSDEDLLRVVTQGTKPEGDTFLGFLREISMPDCIFASFHTWELNEPEKTGIIWKLRSIPP
ncbi:MAG TPA: hypothetical protein VFN67_08810, partial [Polyangiales bacterium]|nr:hypothetical protein [Polyangiales bacterium]